MKKQMLMLVACVILAVGVAGCNEDEKITASQLQAFGEPVQELSVAVDGFQVVVGEMLETMQMYGIVGDNTVEKAEKVSEEIDRVQPQMADIIAALMKVDVSGEDEVANWAKLIRAGTQASAFWNPYALPIALGLDLVLLVWALLKRKEAEKNALKYQAHKQGAEKTSIELEEKKKLLLYSNIGNARANLGVK